MHLERSALFFVLLSTGSLIAGCGAARRDPPSAGDVTGIGGSAAARELSVDEQARHVLDRLAFGARPGDVATVKAIGVDAWIAQQLHPERIPGDSADRLADNLTSPFMSPSDAMRGLATGRGDSATRRLVRQRYGEAARAVQAARLARAVGSERQLQETLVDLWANHFSVFAGKGPVRLYLAQYENEAIRPHVLGKFRDLLGAVAHSPAMLFYLDNWQSVADSSHRTLATGRRGAPKRRVVRTNARGLNENYGRELLELHTLGVDGGYTQQDVIDVARAFTGWSIAAPRNGGGFVFRPTLHDAGVKRVLGKTIAAGGGQQDGERVLDILARQPATARMVATTLARRLVSDDPPATVIDRAVATYIRTDGDLREIVRTIVTSPEFFSRAAYRAKVKSPLELVASALRATGAPAQATPGAVRAVAQLGAPLYGHRTPEGWTERSSEWLNAGAVADRVNFIAAIVARPQVDDSLRTILESPDFQRR